ncbi:MAG: hypothetical protein E7211_19115 [Clostridium lundense]|nr:hypothetical protein [Clostridium lundense]MBE6515801.1 hypothetical protein [Methanocorpusculum parvum]
MKIESLHGDVGDCISVANSSGTVVRSTLAKRCSEYCGKYEQSKRNIKLDILKGIAIFCMVWGHVIQYGTANGLDFFENPIFQFIYSFHMPLFMIISGYLAYTSIHKRRILQQWIHWGRTLLIPLISWTFIAYFIYNLALFIVKGSLERIAFSPMLYWFIISLIVCGVIATLVKFLFNDSIIVYTLIEIVLIVTTINVFNIGWMFPFFMAGYLINNYSQKSKLIFDRVCTACLFLFPILMMFYSSGTYSYLSGGLLMDFLSGTLSSMSFVEYGGVVLHNVYKLLTGFAGCGFLYCVVEKMLQINIPIVTATFAWFGKESLNIYLISVVIVSLLFGRLLSLFNITNIVIYDFLITLPIAIITTLLITYIGRILHKNRIINMILLGGR